MGDWVLIRFSSEETGKQRKLSRPWHGPYQIISANDTNITGGKVYFPRDDLIKVHQHRVKLRPKGFMAWNTRSFVVPVPNKLLVRERVSGE